MKWRNVKLIWQREVRDQFRDRRTLFTIAVLPMLLYPLMGTLLLQVSQFMREHPTHVAIMGQAALPESPVLLTEQKEQWRFAAPFASDELAQLLPVDVLGAQGEKPTPADEIEQATKAVSEGRYDAVVYFPPNFRDQLARMAEKVRVETTTADDLADKAPQPRIVFNAASDKSKIAHDRVSRVLDHWRKEIVRQSLEQRHIPTAAVEPFDVQGTDVAPPPELRAALWSKILPFVALVWALTGAFYPAIDLCAGEKERGTLETLLSSPAGRSEIVCGKLLTVMVFSMATSILNLASMGVTGIFVIQQFQHGSIGVEGMAVGPPPLSAALWLVLALVPISAFFSAISLAVAALARSSKEGQYYLMPILLISLPLMILPVLPAVELDLGKSLIPLTGMMLLLRCLIEGRFAEALPFCLPVIAVTSLCCWLAIRWAVDQFNNESVLFRESERFGLGDWFRHMVRDREETPSLGEGMLCGMLLLAIRFLANFAAPPPQSWRDVWVTTVVMQIALIATPALLMTIILTRSPRKTLLLNWPNPLAALMAVLLAVCWHPAAMSISHAIQLLYPIDQNVQSQLKDFEKMLLNPDHVLAVLAIVALLPAICEELAFRGFVLSGLRHMGRRWTAIVLSSAFFGITHGILQQSISACITGMILGYLAVQTGSLLPCVLFHATLNGLTVGLSFVTPETVEDLPVLRLFLEQEKSEAAFLYGLAWSLVSMVLAGGILVWFRQLPLLRTSEEKLRDAIHQQAGTVPVA